MFTKNPNITTNKCISYLLTLNFSLFQQIKKFGDIMKLMTTKYCEHQFTNVTKDEAVVLLMGLK